MWQADEWNRKDRDPTPAQIGRALVEIQRGWTPEIEKARRHGPEKYYVEPPLFPSVAAVNDQSGKLVEFVPVAPPPERGNHPRFA